MQKIFEKLNYFCSWFYTKFKKKKHSHKPLSESLEHVFRLHGPGLYQVCFVAGESFVSKAIVKVSNFFRRLFRKDEKIYNISHCEFAWYSTKDLKAFYLLDVFYLLDNNNMYETLFKKYNEYYNNKPGNYISIKDIKVFTLAGCRGNGVVYHNFSEYNNKHLFLRKLTSLLSLEKKILSDLLDEKYANQPYDYWGMKSQFLISYIATFFKKIGFKRISKAILATCDSKHHHFCSEQQYEIPLKYGIKTCDIENPSPADIFAYKKDWIEIGAKK